MQIKQALIVIPARYGSTRFPGKPLEMISGKSLIQRVFEQCKQVIDADVVIATDDLRIFEQCAFFGANAIMTQEHPSGTDRVAEAVSKLSSHYQYVINVQGDEPFIDPQVFAPLIQAFENPTVEIATLYHTMDEEKEIPQPSIIKVCKDINQDALFFSRSIIPYKREPIPVAYFKHVGIYAFLPEVLKKLVKLPSSEIEKAESLEQLRWMYNGYKIRMVETKYTSVSIDTPEDIAKVNSQI